MEWRDFWWEVEGARVRDEEKWRHTREVLAMIHNNIAASNGKRPRTKGEDIVSLSIDKERPKPERPGIREFLEAVKKQGGKIPEKAKKWLQ